MVKWSRIKLVFSVLTAAGLWQTIRERVAFAPRVKKSNRPSGESGRNAALPTHFDVAGALHVHSTYSDGTGTIPEIADAAARARADFVLVTDHSTMEGRDRGEEGWHAGGKVLIGVGTEISTDTGHLLLCDIPRGFDVEPGPATEIMDRTVEAGGYGFIALPCDLKDHWRDFSKREDSFGIEVFNLSAVARTKINLPSFLMALLRYRSRQPISAFSFIAGRPTEELELWDRLSAEAFDAGKPIPRAIGCLDAHAVMRFGGREYPYPTYEEVFKTMRTHMLLPEPLSRQAQDAPADLKKVHQALRSGHCYVSYDNFGDAAGFSFQARSEKEVVAGMGDVCTLDPQLGAFMDIRSPAPKSIIRLYRNGRLVAKSRGSDMRYSIDTQGVYRVEVDNYRSRIGPFCFGVHPWIFSNPIEVRPAAR